MYDELIKALHEGAEFLECSTPGIKNSFAKMCHNAADAIEELSADCDMYRKGMTDEHNKAARLLWDKEHCWIPITERLPRMDVQPVVLCKDCRHRDPEDNYCDCGQLERQGCMFPVRDNYWCACGEKREES